MGRKRRKSEDEQDLTNRLLDEQFDEDRLETQQRFSRRSAGAQQRQIEQTALLRAAEEAADADVGALPAGQVIQVYSLYYNVECAGRIHLCVVRKTLSKLLESPVVVGDRVRIRGIGSVDEQGRPEGVIETVLPRTTVLTRADSFNPDQQQPIVANAEQMLIVASLLEPSAKWGLIDRMIVAAKSGGLVPLVCLNKVDLAQGTASAAEDLVEAQQFLGYYESLGIHTLQTSAPANLGLENLAASLKDRVTVLAGHSGVGKSSLVNAIQPQLHLRTGAISGYTGKGRHTTTSSQRYSLDFGGHIIDTPGVKLFGLWGVTPETLSDHFPDLDAPDAPQWRRESYERILQSL